jgi:Mn-dependent DtxR family transcriptional regulator
MEIALRHRILVFLTREGASTLSHLSGMMGISRQAVFNSLKRLMRKGWVERIDRGVYLITEDGKRVVEKMALV